MRIYSKFLFKNLEQDIKLTFNMIEFLCLLFYTNLIIDKMFNPYFHKPKNSLYFQILLPPNDSRPIITLFFTL